MSLQNRQTLKEYFREGNMPSAKMFEDLIESNLNMEDEGFKKSPQHGFEIRTLGSHDSLMSFYGTLDPKNPLWSLGYVGNNQLTFENHRGQNSQALLTLDMNNRVGINSAHPSTELDVNGLIKSQGRLGYQPDGFDQPYADGKEYTIAGPFQGMQAIEVVASAGNRLSRKFALMHALALNAYNPTRGLLSWLGIKRPIRYHNAFYGSYMHRLKLKWKTGKQGQYFLQIKSTCHFGKDIPIHYSVCRLWSDPEQVVQTEPQAQQD